MSTSSAPKKKNWSGYRRGDNYPDTGGYSCPEVCRRPGVATSNVTRRELEAENRRLKKENKRLEMERGILKKAAAFFAKESR